MMYFGDNCFLNICYCYALELEILPWTQDFLKQCHAVCPILHTICDQVWTSIFTGMANPKLMTCQCHYSVFQDLFFFRCNGEDDAIQALRGEKGDSIQRRKWRENNKGETQRQRKEEGGMRHKKADGKVTETKDSCRTCLKGSRVSDCLIGTVTIRFT